MESRILLIGVNDASSASALKKVLAIATPAKVQCIGALQYRGPQLVEQLEKLESISGVRVIVTQNADTRWDSLLALALSFNGIKQAYRVTICGPRLREHPQRNRITAVFPYPLSLGELLSWLFADQLPPLFALSESDLKAAKYFLRVDWHSLKYSLHKSDAQRDQVRNYLGFLDAYPSAHNVKSILGEAGANVYEVGERLKKAWLVDPATPLAWNDWLKRHDALISGFDVMHSLSHRR